MDIAPTGLTSTEEIDNDLIKDQSLHYKFDHQLVDMLASHQAKRSHVEAAYIRVFSYPDSIRWQMVEAAMGDSTIPLPTPVELDKEVAEQQAYMQRKKDQLDEIIRLIPIEQGFRADGKVERDPIGTTYYIDSDNGNDGNAGTSTGAAWATLDQFTENARSAGDIAICRRGMTNRYDDGTDLNFTSDGTMVAPIVLEADYGDAFGDHVDLSVTATATLTFGSKTITFSSDVSGVVVVGDQIYASGDAAKSFAYEVASVSTVTVTLYLPYKGAQAGSGVTMFNMQSTPKWNTAAGDFQVVLNNDYNWLIQGIHFRGTDTNGVCRPNITSVYFRDCIFEGNGNLDYGMQFIALGGNYVFMSKCRIHNVKYGLWVYYGDNVFWKEGLIDCNSVTLSAGIQLRANGIAVLSEVEIINSVVGDIAFFATSGAFVYLRNPLLTGSTEIDSHHTSVFGHAFVEDHDGTPSDTRQLTVLSQAEGTPIIQSETTEADRSGGGNTVIKVAGSDQLGTAWELSRVKLFEIPFYATTSEKTYSVYFKPTATADWTADPTASELWIEAEYWGHASNNFRAILKSTGTIDMNGSTSWAALTVTVTPAQAGVLYLRGYYAKTKESGKANTFFCDPLVDVS